MAAAAAAARTVVSTRPLAELETELMPLVWQGDEQVQAGACSVALALYSRAMDSFLAAGHQRPKLQGKIDAAKAQLME